MAPSDGAELLTAPSRAEHLGDFTLRPRVLRIIGLGDPGRRCRARWLALALLRLIGLMTNLVFYGRVSTRPDRAGRRAPQSAR